MLKLLHDCSLVVTADSLANIEHY